jgi:hypothetical protein
MVVEVIHLNQSMNIPQNLVPNYQRNLFLVFFLYIVINKYMREEKYQSHGSTDYAYSSTGFDRCSIL